MTAKTPSMLVKNFEDAGNMLAEFAKQFQEIRASGRKSENVVEDPSSIDQVFENVLVKTGHYAEIIRPMAKKMRYHLDFAHDFIRYAYIKITDAVVEQQLQEIEAHYVQTAGQVEQFNDVIGDIYDELMEQEKFLSKRQEQLNRLQQVAENQKQVVVKKSKWLLSFLKMDALHRYLVFSLSFESSDMTAAPRFQNSKTVSTWGSLTYDFA